MTAGREPVFAALREKGLCARCSKPLTEKERALEGVGGSYVRCDECVLELLTDPRIVIPGETELWQKVAELLYTDFQSDTPPGAANSQARTEDA